MVDVKVELIDGSYHDVDSSEMAFKIAGSMAIQEAAKRAKPVLLEPVMAVEVVTPEDFLGDVIGDLSRRRGKRPGPGAARQRAGRRRHRPAERDVRLRRRPALGHPGPRRPTRCSSSATRKCPRNIAEEIIEHKAGEPVGAALLDAELGYIGPVGLEQSGPKCAQLLEALQT